MEKRCDINRSLLKSLDTLEILAQADDGFSLSELSERVGHPISTTHRILSTLAERGYVEQDPQTRRYYLGFKILTLQARGIRHRQLTRLAFPHLIQLKQQINTTVNLGVPSQQDVVYLETFAPDTSFAFYSPPGTRMPLYCTAMGKVFLAHFPTLQRREIFDQLDLEPLTPFTIASIADLKAQLQEIFKRGYAIDDQEYTIGVRCLSAPIRDHTGRVIAGASMTVPAEQLSSAQIEPMAALLVQTCLDISKALGYRGDS
jgi:IclR family transcriptional regulator, KDG regulon repressor